MQDREFLMDWLVASVAMLGDELDGEELERMTVSELEELAWSREQKLREVFGESAKKA